MTRNLALSLAVLAALLAGATCVPLFDLTARTPTAGTQLGVSVRAPSQTRIVPTGTKINVEWSVGNLTSDQAVATVFVRSRDDGSRTIIDGGVIIPGQTFNDTTVWDSTGFPSGDYGFQVRVETVGATSTADSDATITLNDPPSWEWLEPSEPTTLTEPNDPNDPNAENTDPQLTFRWSAGDTEGDGTYAISIDPDLDHTSGNEVTIQEDSLPVDVQVDFFDWNGNDTGNQRVEAGTYNYYVTISDEVSPERIIEGLAQITVPEAPPEPNDIVLAVTKPAEDTTFLTTDPPLAIAYTLDEPNDVIIDLRIDADENRRNGNEITILSERLVETETTSGNFEWDGTDSDGNAVGDGIYNVFISVNRGTATPATVDADGLVFRRSFEDQPLIGLLGPATNTTVNAGDFVQVRWRDDDPNGDALIRLTLDDDDTPDQGEDGSDPNDIAERTILDNRSADGDGVQDTFSYQIPTLSNLPPGTYFIFAYIRRPDGPAYDMISVAAGRIIVADPAN